MLYRYIIFTLFSFVILNSTDIVDNSSNSFITKVEYGKLLYKNPRGIGCNLCHGENGEGKFIATYQHKNFSFSINTANIKKLTYKEFLKNINNSKNSSIMPQYFLTNEEIHSIYVYLQSISSKK